MIRGSVRNWFQLFDYRLQKSVLGPALVSTSWHNLGQISNIDGANNGMDTCRAKVRCGVLGLLLQHGGPQTPAPLFVPNTHHHPPPPPPSPKTRPRTPHLDMIFVNHFTSFCRDGFEGQFWSTEILRIEIQKFWKTQAITGKCWVNRGKGRHQKIYNTWQFCVLYSE